MDNNSTFEAGKQFGIFIKEIRVSEMTVSNIQALVRDCLPQDRELLKVMLSVVAMPSFMDLIPFAGTGSSCTQCDKLLEEIAIIYTGNNLEKIVNFVDGLLGLSSSSLNSVSKLKDSNLTVSKGQEIKAIIPGNYSLKLEVIPDSFSATDYLQKRQNNTHSNLSSYTKNGLNNNHSARGVGAIIGLLGILGFLVLAFSGIDNLSRTTYTSDDQSIDSQSTSLNPDQDSYKKIMLLKERLNKATLKCEYLPLINEVKNIAGKSSDLQNLKTEIIDNAEKSIAYLEANGKFNYSEDDACTYGFQWFDEDTNSEFRAFVAVSQQCRQPILLYSFSRTNNGPKFQSGQLNMSGHRIGEIRIPFPSEEAYISIDGVQCS